MKIITYNVMFNDIDRTKRLLLLIELLKGLSADIICLQEITNDVLSLLLFSLSRYYICIDTDIRGLKSYKEVIFYKPDKYKHLEINSIELPSNYNRSLNKIIFREISTNRYFYLYTFHLESLNNIEYRKEQIKILNEDIKNSLKLPVICCGDTNLKKGEAGLSEIDYSFTDAWRYVGSPERGEITSHGCRFFDDNIKERYDRFWTRDFKIKMFQILGRKPVNDLFISDHDGILCELIFIN